MADDEDLTPPEEESNDAPPAPPVATPQPIAAPASITLSTDDVRNSPEYRALAEQNRRLARQAGSAQQAASAAREAAEAARLAAEAEQAAVQARQMEEILGPEGIEAWNQIAELSSTDPVAAATALRRFQLSGQTATGGDLGAVDLPVPQEGAPPVPAQGTGAPPPPPMGSSLHADSPLGSIAPQNDDDATIAALDKRFNDLADRAQHPLSTSRLTVRERDEGIMAHFAAGVVRAKKAMRQGT